MPFLQYTLLRAAGALFLLKSMQFAADVMGRVGIGRWNLDCRGLKDDNDR